MTTQRNTLLIILNAAIIGLMLLVIGLLFARPAQAGVIHTLDFQDQPAGMNGSSNFNYRGMRFSPACRISAAHLSGQVWLHSDHDNSNCEVYDENGDIDRDQIPNQDFLGPYLENFYVDRRGKPFTLHGLAGVGYYGTDFGVSSSKGGHFRGVVPYSDPELPYVLPWRAFDLTGPEWTDITWFTLSHGTEGFGWQPHMGWDDIRVSWRINEPPPLWLLLTMAPVGLLINWQHRRTMRAQP